MEPMSVRLAEGEVSKVVQAAGRHTPSHLIGNKRHIAMIKDVDRDPVKHTIRYVAFLEVRADVPVVAEVPIRLIEKVSQRLKRTVW